MIIACEVIFVVEVGVITRVDAVSEFVGTFHLEAHSAFEILRLVEALLAPASALLLFRTHILRLPMFRGHVFRRATVIQSIYLHLFLIPLHHILVTQVVEAVVLLLVAFLLNVIVEEDATKKYRADRVRDKHDEPGFWREFFLDYLINNFNHYYND